MLRSFASNIARAERAKLYLTRDIVTVYLYFKVKLHLAHRTTHRD